MELTALRQFVVIAESGHITRAAQRLGVSQPALSAMLKKLESEVGAPLLDRTGRGVLLTEAGRVFLEHAQASVRRADEAVASVRELIGLESGSIRIGGGATAVAHLMPSVVSAVRRAYPALRFYVREAGSRAVADAVLSGELDIGIVTTPITGPGSEDLMTVATIQDELMLVVPEDHPLAGQSSYTWSSIREDPLVLFEHGSAVRNIIDRASRESEISLNVVMEVRSTETIERMVEAGIGPGFISRFALGDKRGLICKDGRLFRELAVVRRRDRVPSAASAVFERMLIAELAAYSPRSPR
ncbi:MAG: LysR family transcriptional regulator [Phycisphaerales bacterium]|nr:LysR family transcriptional regulator [Phycisphaerales bacterium]MCB9835300.1 LysR family transcriptional regulator [Phycisphaera sp.]